MMRIVAVLALAAVVTASVSSEFSEESELLALEFPPLPRAEELPNETDPKAEQLEKEEFNNPALEMLEDAMEGKLDDTKDLAKARSTDGLTKAEEAAAEQKKTAEEEEALAEMDADIKAQERETAAIKKQAEERRKHDHKVQEKFDKFAEMRRKYTTFSNTADEEQLTEEVATPAKAPEAAKAAEAAQAAAAAKAALEAKEAKDAEEAEAAKAAEPPKEKRHTKKLPHHTQPVHYGAVPTGKAARAAAADLASGAAADRNEDWAVHEATYDALNPNAHHAHHEHHSDKAKKPVPKPLKNAQVSFHKGLDSIHQTKEILRTPLRVLTLAMAKSNCKKIRAKAEKECKSNEHATHFYCIDVHRSQTDCDRHKEKDAATCKVAHETAFNECYSLWNRAKKNIKKARLLAAAPMQHTDDMVKSMQSGAGKCSTMMTKAKADCKTAFSKSKGSCKKKMLAALDAEEMDFAQMLGTGGKAEKKIAQKGAAQSAATLKKAEKTLAMSAADSKTKAALVECNLEKNVAKRTCINAVHLARDACDKLTSSGVEDRNSD